MSINKYKPHIYVIPEDDANRQILNGFLQHPAVAYRTVHDTGLAKGWPNVLVKFQTELLPLIRKFPHGHVVMLIDFDEDQGRRRQFEMEIPEDVKSRVFVLGSRDEPETLRNALKLKFEDIGRN
jgi:hypothetical protein